ncbi:MAG: hypothetical protein FWD53_02600 [Phycisphaerales bacterium]|nr:hypothetical protein [Phycisphaerales bacterium]
MKPQDKRKILIALMVAAGLATLGCVVGMFFVSDHYSVEFVGPSGMGLVGLLLASFAAFMCLHHPFWKFPALAGMAVAAIFMFFHPFAMFLHVHSYSHHSFKTDLFHLCERIDGFGFTLVGLLCLVPFVMAPRIKSSVRLLQLAVALSCLLLFVYFQGHIWKIISYPDLIDKAATAIGIFAVAGIFVVFLLNQFFGIKIKNPVTYSAATVHLQCPRCKTFQDVSEGESVCHVCNLRFKFEVEEPVCAKCGYNLYNLTGSRCPECGTVFRAGINHNATA